MQDLERIRLRTFAEGDERRRDEHRRWGEGGDIAVEWAPPTVVGRCVVAFVVLVGARE